MGLLFKDVYYWLSYFNMVMIWSFTISIMEHFSPVVVFIVSRGFRINWLSWFLQEHALIGFTFDWVLDCSWELIGTKCFFLLYYRGLLGFGPYYPYTYCIWCCLLWWFHWNFVHIVGPYLLRHLDELYLKEVKAPFLGVNGSFQFHFFSFFCKHTLFL